MDSPGRFQHLTSDFPRDIPEVLASETLRPMQFTAHLCSRRVERQPGGPEKGPHWAVQAEIDLLSGIVSAREKAGDRPVILRVGLAHSFRVFGPSSPREP